MKYEEMVEFAVNYFNCYEWAEKRDIAIELIETTDNPAPMVWRAINEAFDKVKK